MSKSPISELQISIYKDPYIGQPQPRIAAGARQHAGALCSMYESSYIKNCNSDIELMFFQCDKTSFELCIKIV